MGDLPLAVGIGLNYGPAVLDDVGSEHSLSFTVIGDTVNVASHLQRLTRDLKTPVVVADAIVKQIGGGSAAGGAARPRRARAARPQQTTRRHLDTDTR